MHLYAQKYGLCNPIGTNYSLVLRFEYHAQSIHFSNMCNFTVIIISPNKVFGDIMVLASPPAAVLYEGRYPPKVLCY